MTQVSTSGIEALSALAEIRGSLEEAFKLAIEEATEERDFLVSVYHNMNLSPATTPAINATVSAMEQILRDLDIPVATEEAEEE